MIVCVFLFALVLVEIRRKFKTIYLVSQKPIKLLFFAKHFRQIKINLLNESHVKMSVEYWHLAASGESFMQRAFIAFEHTLQSFQVGR